MSNEDKIELLKGLSESDGFLLLRSIAGDAGKAITQFMVEWNMEGADREELGNQMNERMYMPTEAIGLLSLMLSCLSDGDTIHQAYVRSVQMKEDISNDIDNMSEEDVATMKEAFTESFNKEKTDERQH